MELMFKIDDTDSISMVKGEERQFVVRLLYKDSLRPVSMSGATATLRMQNSDSTYLTLTGSIGSPNELGQVTFTITEAQSLLLLTGPYLDVEFQWVISGVARIHILRRALTVADPI